MEFVVPLNRTRKYHGLSKTSTYKIWEGLHQRCRNPKNKSYKNYGGRGIFVCKEWYNFETFLKDMGVRPENLELDRVNNDLGYSKENCRWTTRSVNNRTRRYWNKTGLRGISKHKSGGWEASINNKNIRYREYFNSLDEAILWRKNMEKKVWEEVC